MYPAGVIENVASLGTICSKLCYFKCVPVIVFLAMLQFSHGLTRIKHGFFTVSQSLKFYSFFTKIDKQSDSNTGFLKLVY